MTQLIAGQERSCAIAQLLNSVLTGPEACEKVVYFKLMTSPQNYCCIPLHFWKIANKSTKISVSSKNWLNLFADYFEANNVCMASFQGILLYLYGTMNRLEVRKI